MGDHKINTQMWGTEGWSDTWTPVPNTEQIVTSGGCRTVLSANNLFTDLLNYFTSVTLLLFSLSVHMNHLLIFTLFFSRNRSRLSESLTLNHLVFKWLWTVDLEFPLVFSLRTWRTSLLIIYLVFRDFRFLRFGLYLCRESISRSGLSFFSHS